MAISPGSAIPVTYTQYTAAGIVFAKVNDNNLAVAKLNNAAADSLTEVFKPVTLAVGKITSASTSTTAIVGTNTLFKTDFVEGDYLFYYTADATPVLLGRIAVVNGDTSITLTEFSSTNISAVPAYCGKSDMVITGKESMIMRIPVLLNTQTQVFMPNWNAYRITKNQPSSYNNTDSSSMVTYSEVNSPTIISDNPINIDYTINPIWNYTVTTGSDGARYVFATPSEFPNYAYALLNPYGDSTSQNLPQNTLYKLFANERFENNGIVVNTKYPLSFLQAAGY